jgi:DNA-binding transcriptional LysR family regulator
MDLDLRLVRYFAVVAEHRHFGRAAAALRVAQPSLSRQIRRLEQQLGARLLDRTPRGTALTEAGEVFLPLAQGLLASATQAAARTRAAAQPSRITIGYMGNIFVTEAVRELRALHPDADVHVQHLEWHEPREALLAGQVDAAVTRLPFPTDQLDVTALYDEPRCLLVREDHRLAGKEYVTLDDIADESLPRVCDEAWNSFWRVDPRPDGSRAPDGPLIASLQDKFEYVAAGDAIAIVSNGLRAEKLRPGLTTVPLEGVELAHVVLATRAGDTNRLLTAFREIARARLTAPPVFEPHPAVPGSSSSALGKPGADEVGLDRVVAAVGQGADLVAGEPAGLGQLVVVDGDLVGGGDRAEPDHQPGGERPRL